MIASAPRDPLLLGHERKATARKRFGAQLKLVRRLHMYLGLLLFPWILLFGISGMLFNHPKLGRNIEERVFSTEEFARLTGFQPWNAASLSEQVVAQVNRQESQRVELDKSFRARFFGWPILAAPRADGGRYVLIPNLETGGATLALHDKPEKQEMLPFANSEVELPKQRMATIAKQVEDLLPKVGESAAKPFAVHPKVAPELRFRVRTEDGRRWNVSYNLKNGELSGRPLDVRTQGLTELLGALHTTHHYPVHSGASFFWALFADLTGITLVVWALTGLFMWWQMKPTRALGVMAVSAALGIAIVCIAATTSEVEFGYPQTSGP